MDGFLKLVPSNIDKLKKTEQNQKAQAEADLSQQPWVEKYRPNTLDDIVYQENVVNALKKTKATGKMQHLLFYGPPGTGKTSTIIALAKELFGSNYRDRILELNASDERGIQVVREKVKKFSQKIVAKISNNSNAKFQIVILDEADSMTTDAQSALRRIIEDYTAQTRFCIICNYVSKIIDPIASRCAKFRFSPLSKKSQIDRLEYIRQQERVCISQECLHFLQEISEGDLRRSINLLQSISQLDIKLIREDVINDICGVIPMREVVDIINVCKTKNIDDIVKSGNALLMKGYDMRQLLVEMNECITKDAGIDENKRKKIFEIILDKEIALLENSSSEILCYDLLTKIGKVFQS